MLDLETQDASTVGARLKAARMAAQVTQEGAATAIGAIRTTLVGIEQGSRRIKPEELVKLADLYGVSVHELLQQEEFKLDLVPQFRRTLPKPTSALGDAEWDSVRLLERLVTNYLEVERLTGKPLARNYPEVYSVKERVSAEAAEAVAMAERARLGLGLAPIPDIILMLEIQVGLRIFTRSVHSRISGIFGYHEKAGGCILVNASHRAGRQALSAAHEYWHFLTNRQKPEVLHDGQDSLLAGDRTANQFAMAFLMPAIAVQQIYESSAAGGKFTPASIFYLAHVFNVSVEAMTRRLEQLEIVRPNTWRSLKERGLKVDEVREKLGLPEPKPRTNAPLRFLTLSVNAHLQGNLSEGELSRLLMVDRLTVREWVDEFGGMAAEASK